MGNLAGVNLNEVKDDDMPTGGRGDWYVKPAGWYRVMATEAPVKPSKSGNGQVIHAKFNHLDASNEGDFEKAFIVVQHSSAKAQEIGRATLKAWAIATGHHDPGNVQDTSELLSRPFMLDLYSKNEGGDYSDSNGDVQKIGGYLSVSEWMDKHGDAPAPTSAQAPQNTPAPPAPAGADVPF